MELPFVKISPTQNVTILVEKELPRALHGEIAQKLLAYDNVGGEQVGFLETPQKPGAEIRLQMMGGEFCGNATMATGAYLAEKTGLSDGASHCYAIEVSGADSPVPCTIVRRGNAYEGTVRMPLPSALKQYSLMTDHGIHCFPAVVFDGITHIIVERTVSFEEAERRIAEWNETVQAFALGILLWRNSFMDPLVYVPSSGTCVRERGCGSGSAAMGCFLAQRLGTSCMTDIAQPGGTIRVQACWENKQVTELRITGSVRITARGLAMI